MNRANNTDGQHNNFDIKHSGRNEKKLNSTYQRSYLKNKYAKTVIAILSGTANLNRLLKCTIKYSCKAIPKPVQSKNTKVGTQSSIDYEHSEMFYRNHTAHVKELC